MLRGAMDELRVGDPADIASDVGPIIDEEARARLEAHASALEAGGKGRLLHACRPGEGTDAGCFFAPRLYEIDSIAALDREVFGPVVHLVRYRAKDLEKLPALVNATGYGLTFGVHSRIQSSVDLLAREVHAGNVYVNRNIIGAIVGVQPFGGQGLSGTGPKAGGPLYLARLLKPAAGAPHDHPALPELDHASRLAEVFDCKPVLQSLAEAQRDWGAAELRQRFAHARTLCEQASQDPGREHDARAALAAELHSLLDQASTLAQSGEMPGPTGESNTLAFGGRGTMACLARDGASERDLLLPATAALVSGNTVMFLVDAPTQALVMRVRDLLGEAGFPDNLCAHHVFEDLATLLEVLRRDPLDGAVCHGDTALAAAASRALAAREGAILPLIDECFGPLYVQRFVHEKSVSANTTASGGNAALMSQSESD